MKRWIIVLAVLSIVMAGCVTSDFEYVNGPYEKIITISKTKDEAYSLTMQWIAQAFKSAKAVIQYADKDSGIIVGNGNGTADFGGLVPGTVSFKITIDIKDYKERVTFSEVRPVFDNSSSGQLAASITPGLTGHAWPKFETWADDTIESLQQFVATKSSDW